MKWTRPRSSRLRMLSRRAVAAKSEQTLLKKALFLPAQKTQAIVKNVTKAGQTQLEVAIKTLSLAFATPRQQSRSSDNITNDISRSQHGRRGSNSSIISDITLPSTVDFTSEAVSSAEEIVMNARRKQAILIGIMIKLQAHWRVQLAKQALLDLQRYGARQERSASSPSFYGTRRRIRASIRLQTWLRCNRIRQNYIRNRNAAMCIQKHIRCSRIRLGYVLLAGIITRFQAVIRRHNVQKEVLSQIRNRMKVYRSQLFSLWKQTFTPLSYRTKYWTAIKHDDIFCLSLAERELNRIWSSLKLSNTLESGTQSRLSSTTLTLTDPLGMVDVSFQRAMQVSS
jgi:IQ calmodulin-binding motif